jgi:predicted metalloprotease with PDZ domain
MRHPALPIVLIAASLVAPASRQSFLTSSAFAQSGTVRYDVAIPRPETQTARMAMTISGIPKDRQTIEIHLPVWRPGLYMILDQAGSVRDVTAYAADVGGVGESAVAAKGRPLVVNKYQKSSWRVETKGSASIRVEYTIWAASLENRTRHIDDTHAFFSPSAVFMYAPEWRNLPVEVSLDVPKHWSVATGLGAAAPGGRLFAAADFDVLVDSPIEAGVHDVLSFDAAGGKTEFVVWTGEPSLKRPGSIRETEYYKKLPADLTKLIEAHEKLFGSLPYERYVFLAHCYPSGRGGTEHVNSTVIQFTPAAFRDKDAYDRLLRLCSHEFFHTWDVKAFRPAGLVPYDYQRENYTDLLWLAEGTTSYYQDVLMVRAGLMKPADYFKSLAKSIDAAQKLPGARVQSVADSSFDAWVKHSRATPDDPNTTVSFYGKGAMVSFLMDMTIRASTAKAPDGEKSMDDLLRALYQEFPNAKKGYTSDDVRRLLGGLLGSRAEADTFFADYIEGTREIDFAKALAAVGLRLDREKKPGAASKPDREGATPRDDSTLTLEGGGDIATPDEKAYAGVTVTDKDGLAQVATVLSDGPGFGAGLEPGDLIVALDGARVTSGAWEKAIEQRKPGEVVRVSFFRHDLMRETVLALASRPAGELKVVRDEKSSDAARRAYESWLGEKWPEKKDQKE